MRKTASTLSSLMIGWLLLYASVNHESSRQAPHHLHSEAQEPGETLAIGRSESLPEDAGHTYAY